MDVVFSAIAVAIGFNVPSRIFQRVKKLVMDGLEKYAASGVVTRKTKCLVDPLTNAVTDRQQTKQRISTLIKESYEKHGSTNKDCMVTEEVFGIIRNRGIPFLDRFTKKVLNAIRYAVNPSYGPCTAMNREFMVICSYEFCKRTAWTLEPVVATMTIMCNKNDRDYASSIAHTYDMKHNQAPSIGMKKSKANTMHGKDNMLMGRASGWTLSLLNFFDLATTETYSIVLANVCSFLLFFTLSMAKIVQDDAVEGVHAQEQDEPRHPGVHQREP